jgi:hypothetical protein
VEAGRKFWVIHKKEGDHQIGKIRNGLLEEDSVRNLPQNLNEILPE